MTDIVTLTYVIVFLVFAQDWIYLRYWSQVYHKVWAKEIHLTIRFSLHAAFYASQTHILSKEFEVSNRVPIKVHRKDVEPSEVAFSGSHQSFHKLSNDPLGQCLSQITHDTLVSPIP